MAVSGLNALQQSRRGKQVTYRCQILGHCSPATGASSIFVVAVDPPTDRNPDYWVSRWARPCSACSPTETETTLVRGCAGWAGECGCGRACGRRFLSACNILLQHVVELWSCTIVAGP